MSCILFHAGLHQHLPTMSNGFNDDLIEWVLKEHPEIQCNIRTDIGKPKTIVRPGKKPFKHRVDGDIKFWPVRYPKNAKTDPEWDEDPVCNFPFTLFEEIGTTGYSPSGNQAYGYDLDDVWGHKEGLSDERLKEICDKSQSVDYVELRRSTRGKGIHAWIRAEGIFEANHDEHAAAARALLGQWCLDAGLDFRGDVDAVGSNLWIASRRATPENRGYEIIKPSTRILTPDDLPSNWREHIDVVKKRKARLSAPGKDEDQCAEWATNIVMDKQHRRIFDAYEKTGYVMIYNPDLRCWYAHTGGFAIVHDKLKLKGFYATNSKNENPGDPNCYVFLRPNGALFIVRFNSQTEHISWDNTNTVKHEACCLYNYPITLRIACHLVGGIWMGNACTCNLEQAIQLAKMFGFSLPPLESDRPINFKHFDHNTIVAETTQVKGEKVDGWGIGYRKLAVSFDTELPDIPIEYESVARHLIAEKENAGWCMKTETGEWIFEPKETAIDRVCEKFGIPSRERVKVTGRLAANPYKLVNEPYMPEFLPGKRMNKFGAQLSVIPTFGGHHPHFDKILRHVGQGLDEAVKKDEWCQANGITTGYDYILLWCALLIQMPKQPLPMLYLYSSLRDNGKSALHRALGLLFARGYVEGVRALNEKFNKLLAGAVLVYLDEEKISHESAQKVKLYIDSDKITMRLMRTDSFMFDNFIHLIASYNFTDGVTVEDGDERIVMVMVQTLYDEDKLDWTTIMLPALEEEKSDFLGTLMNVELPPSGNRLYLPVLSTPLKEQVMSTNRTNTPCDRKELLARVVEKISDAKHFSGPSQEFAKLLGSGSWDGSRNHLRRYLREIEPELTRNNIKTDFSDSRLICMEMAV